MNNHPHIHPQETDDPFLSDAQEGWNQFPKARRRWWRHKLGFSLFIFGRSWSWLPAAGKVAVGTMTSVAVIAIAAVTIPFNTENHQPAVAQETTYPQKTQESESKDLVVNETTSGDHSDMKDDLVDLNQENDNIVSNQASDKFSRSGACEDSDSDDSPRPMYTITSGTALEETAEAELSVALPFLWIDQYRVLDYDRLVTDLTLAKKEAPASLDSRFSNHDEAKASEPSVSIDTIPYKTFVGDAIIKMKYGNFDDAEYQFKKLQVQYPDDENAMFYLGYCAFQQSEYSKAMVYFDKAMLMTYRAFSSDAEWYKAKIFLLNGDRTQAKNLLKQIIGKKGYYAREAKELLKKEFNE